MKAHEIMTTDVITVHPDTTVREAAALLTERGITSLPVVDDSNRVIGIVSEVDLIRDRMPHDPRSHLRQDDSEDQKDPAQRVAEVMSDVVVCLSANADAADVAELMLDNNVRAVPIVDGSQLVGIVSRRDLLRTLLRDDIAIETEITQRLADLAGKPNRWPVNVHDGVVRIDGRFDDAPQHDVVVLLARTVPGVIRVHTHRHRWL
ncbi:MAG TPA: CBS domain-containing protein [Jatrophihabitantaceae bacterium]|jgi:CBS domain-containing protein|nr:CBS domain-containing protein [Jatrophihabitantaceae bacterium]